MTDNGDKIFIFFLILFEILLILVFMVNAYYFSVIQQSNSSTMSPSTAGTLMTFSIVLVVLFLICLGATCYFLKNEITRCTELQNIEEEVKQLKREKDSPNIHKIKVLTDALTNAKQESKQMKQIIDTQNVKIVDYENDMNAMTSVLQNKTKEMDDLLIEYEELKNMQSSDSSSDASSDSSSSDQNSEISISDSNENLLQTLTDESRKDDEIIIPEDVEIQDENYLIPKSESENKKPGVKWRSDDDGSFLTKLLRESLIK